MFHNILKEIEKYDSIVIFGHKMPDGDCFGSQVAIKELIKLNFPGKKAFTTGSGYRRFFKFIEPIDIVDDEVIKSSLAILVDSNDLPRAEDSRIFSAKAFLKIDHHVDTGTFNEGIYYVDDKANSTCEIIVDLIRSCNLKIDAKIANALYLGNSTDSGRFLFNDNYVKAFDQASWLVKNGADPKEINRILSICDETLLLFKGYVLSNYKKTENGTLYMSFSKEILNKFNISAAKASNMINLLANLSGYPVWAFFVEGENGDDHVEVRSNGPVVQPIVLRHGGGGHLYAAGVTLPTFDDLSIQSFVKELDDAIIEWKRGR